MITNVIIHLENDLPILADVEALPSGGDRTVRCTNVRTVDGKRPGFVHDSRSTFVFPLNVIRLIEAPAESMRAANDPENTSLALVPHALPIDDLTLASAAEPDDEPDEGLLERIRQI